MLIADRRVACSLGVSSVLKGSDEDELVLVVSESFWKTMHSSLKHLFGCHKNNQQTSFHLNSQPFSGFPKCYSTMQAKRYISKSYQISYKLNNVHTIKGLVCFKRACILKRRCVLLKILINLRV